MKKDLLKQEVSLELKKVGRRELVSTFFSHPAVLLIIGFAFTGLIGAYLATWWQSKEWEKQQQRLLDFKGFDQKYEILDDLIKAVGETNASAMALVSPLMSSLTDKQLITDESQPIKDWRKANNDWRIKSKTFELKIATRFKSPVTLPLFNQIAEDEANLTVDVNLLQNKLVESNWMNSNDEAKKDKAKKRIDAILNNIRKTSEDLKQLATVVAAEAQSDVKSSKPY